MPVDRNGVTFCCRCVTSKN
uniref:Uncharacterized protein n=1 Tax=Lotus japonicus TaxID=34305 RepID=I3SJ09_LOTJA|nr:unknown [Lotus japonicus]